MYDRSCSIGPCFVTLETLGDPHNLSIRCAVFRSGDEVFSGETSTSLMSRRCEDLADWLQRYNAVPNMTAVLTGTAIVPPTDFTLHEDDVVSISIEGIGVLENEVVVIGSGPSS